MRKSKHPNSNDRAQTGHSKTHSLCPSESNIFAKRRPVAEKYRMKAERAWFLSEGEKSEA